MEVPWAEAVQIGVIGFSMVFFLLVILGAVIWLTGLVFGKMDAGKIATAGKKKGE